jgi:hypothetical protein
VERLAPDGEETRQLGGGGAEVRHVSVDQLCLLPGWLLVNCASTNRGQEVRMGRVNERMDIQIILLK